MAKVTVHNTREPSDVPLNDVSIVLGANILKLASVVPRAPIKKTKKVSDLMKPTPEWEK
jgi:hypothetical protein